jgi:hypothetical protein
MQTLSLKLLSSRPINEVEILCISVDLAARLLSMVDIGSLQYGFSGSRQLVWNHGSLKEYIAGYFDIPPAIGHGHLKLPDIFKARTLDQIAGIEIFWTNNLADHLRMIDEDKRVAIFHHVSFLECQHK